jgi:predicted ATPase
MIELLEKTSARVPLLILFEDLHWVDPSTVELLRHVIDRVRNRKILVVCTFRQEFQPDWEREPHVTLLQLNRLGRSLGTLMVDRVTGGKALPPEVIEDILDRTDGVPLFVEEFTKNLIEGGILELHGDEYKLVGPIRGLAIPATLQDSLAARLDRLSAAKEIAQWASALGRTFSEQLLMAVVPREAIEVKSAITELVDSEIIYRRGLPPRETHEFKHALLQEAAYAGMVRTRRAQLHSRIATIIREKFPEITRNEPQTLARHLQNAGMLSEAIPLFIGAGDLAAERFARTEARNLFDAALGLARELPPSQEARRAQIEAVLKRATVAIGREQVERDLADLRHARELAEADSDRANLARIAYWIGRSHYVSGDFDKAALRASEALELAAEVTGNSDIEALAVNLLGRIECLRGRPGEAVAHAARNIPQMEALGNHIEVAAMHGVLAFGHALAGAFDEAMPAARQGTALSDRTGHLPTQAACHFFHGLVLGWHGELDASVHAFALASGHASDAGDAFRLYLIHGWRGEVRYLCGDFEGARADLLQCQERAAELGSNYHLPAFKSFMAAILAADGDHAESLSMAEQCVNEARANAQAWPLSIALRSLASVLLDIGRPNDAAEAIDEALSIHARDGVMTDQAHALLTKGRIEMALGSNEEGHGSFARALTLFERMGMPEMVRRTRSIWASAAGKTDPEAFHSEEKTA